MAVETSWESSDSPAEIPFAISRAFIDQVSSLKSATERILSEKEKIQK